MIIEDDPVIAAALQKHLGSWGYRVEPAADFHDILPGFEAFAPQLVLLDISLPFFDGYHWCREIRKQSSVPIIFISSAADNMNIVMAMSMGGDDFIAKPFDLSVLTAKVQALLRRTYGYASQNTLLEHRGVSLDLSEMKLSYLDQKLDLSRNEFRILQVLFEKPGRIVSRDDLMMRLWETDSFIDDNTLTVNVTRLRRKLEEIGLSDFIATKKGVGYFLP